MGSINGDYNGQNNVEYEEEEVCHSSSSQPPVITQPSSMEDENDILLNDSEHPPLAYENIPIITCHQNFADCSNVFKGFIGSAMVGLPFATSKSGIGLALIGVFIIATLTDHCCILIVKCKQMIITKIINTKKQQGIDDVLLHAEEITLGRDLSFGKVGKACLGVPGVVLINTALMITQLGFTIGYFIFLGNTMRSIFKYFLVKNSGNMTSALVQLSATHEHYLHDHLISNTSQLGFNFTSSHSKMLNTSDISTSIFHYFHKKLSVSITPHFLNSSVGFIIFLCVPLPMLILIAFVRNLRKLGPVSVIANASITTAFGATSIYVILQMTSLPDAVTWFKVSTFPIFFGQVTAAFEGIGTVIPIESSMSENRAKYPAFLHISVTGVSLILTSFGIIGYLAFGDNTCQIVTGNLTGPISIVLQILLFIGVLFTYPLQIYPCIQITELIILKVRRWRMKKKMKNIVYEQVVQHESESEEDEQQSIGESTEHSLKNIKLKRWESNIVRASLVTLTAAIALVFRFQFAYIAALTGSIGSSLLSFIIPALCHIHLTGSNKWLKVKDIVLIIFGVIGGVCGVTITMKELIESFHSNHPAHC